MPDESSRQGPRPEPQVKVNDRRRFTPDGEAVPEQEVTSAPEAAQGEAGGPDPRDATLAQQSARIDELMRAYASLVEDGKAARVRLEREKTRVLEAERAQVAQVLLEAVDELERALGGAGDATGPLVDGVRLTLASLAKKVSELGAQRLSVVGQRYDPHLAEAVDVVPVGDRSQDDVVVQEVRAGYRIGERILRPARVRVGRFTQA
ncbi:nucleotide exchange factor GrpE [Anaeromyxobacter diazotrophicus]|uniref:Protein GrpE n=1 Tax=Anaeromyxobacter diazotrophicus TaxID=2590199 RepID=A0A7I9VQM5_9BACT|nr:nucleotide exchange factor GrpE [Anaeromyxobacter diazotrophicus]GEJ58389.1 protein GrpE [Anaeromyxobacter diazotrophicus]